MSMFCSCGRVLKVGRCIECKKNPEECRCAKLKDTPLQRDIDLDLIVEKVTGPLHHH